MTESDWKARFRLFRATCTWGGRRLGREGGSCSILLYLSYCCMCVALVQPCCMMLYDSYDSYDLYDLYVCV